MKLVLKVGKVSIKRQDRDNAIYITWWSSAAGKIITERVRSQNLNTAKKRAAEINAQINKGIAAVRLFVRPSFC